VRRNNHEQKTRREKKRRNCSKAQKKHDLPFSGWIANELSHTDCPIPPYLCILQASKQQTLLIMAPPHSTTTTTIWQEL
jgi:hypothetical protein